LLADNAFVRQRHWLRRVVIALLYLLLLFVALGFAAESSDSAAGIVMLVGIVVPILIVEFRLLRRLSGRRPEQIVQALRKGHPVQLSLPRATATAWDPTKGIFGRVIGPGVAEYELLDDGSLRFRYSGRQGIRESVATVPAVFVPGTKEAQRFSAAKRRLARASIAFYAVLPSAFAVGYYAFGGHGSARIEHGSIAVVTTLCLWAVAARLSSFTLHARSHPHDAGERA
jgi:hypothetical protein